MVKRRQVELKWLQAHSMKVTYDPPMVNGVSVPGDTKVNSHSSVLLVRCVPSLQTGSAVAPMNPCMLPERQVLVYWLLPRQANPPSRFTPAWIPPAVGGR